MLNDSTPMVISLSEFCEKTSFAQEDVLTELKRNGTPAMRMGDNCYLTETIVEVLFNQDRADNFVTNQPICATALDNRFSLELQSTELKDEKEVVRVANATVSKVNDEKRKKPYLVQWRIYFKDGGSERKSKSFATREEAENFVDELNKKNSPAEQPHTELDTYRGIDSSTPFLEYAEFYVLYSGQLTCGDRTKRDYMVAINLFRKHLRSLGRENVTLGEVDDTLCNRVFKEIAKRCAQATLNKVYNFVKRVLKYAFDKQILTGCSYVNLIVKHKSSVVTKERKPYTEEEVDMLLNAAAEYNTRLHTLICMALYTGMRPEEIRALMWEDIDFNNNIISVNKAVVKRYPDLKKSSFYEELDRTKSDKGVRDIPLANEAAKSLEAWRAESLNDPVGKDSKFIFYHPDGEFMQEGQLNKIWGRFIKKNDWKGKEYILYRFRHNYCTRLLEKGTPIQFVQALMGDSTLDVIMKIYNGLNSKNIIDNTREMVNAIH